MADLPRGSPRWRDLQRERLADLNALDLESNLPLELDKERQELAATLDSFSYPVITVPYEIIALIFVHCLPADGRVKPSPHAAPLLLAQICSAWREIALRTRQLWSSFDFTFHRYTIGSTVIAPVPGEMRVPHEHPYNGACALLETWLKRSNGNPISITFRLASNRRAVPSRIFDLVFQASALWERFEATFTYGGQVRMFHQLVHGPFPLLSSLSLNIPDIIDMSINPLMIFENSPRLQDLRLFAGFHFRDIPIGHFPLTTLELDKRVSMADCLEIFQRFPSLIHLRLSTVDALPSPIPAIPQVPSLESLSLESGGDLLTVLTLPHLRRLRYTISAPENLTTLLSFLARSACALHHLTLRVHSLMEDYALLECLQAVPFVEDLRIEYKFPGSRTLYQHLGAPAVLPRLRALTVSENRDTYVYAPLVELLRTRRPQRHDADFVKLVSFDLYLSPVRTASAPSAGSLIPGGISTERITRLVKGGLRFCVHGPGIQWPGGEWRGAS